MLKQFVAALAALIAASAFAAVEANKATQAELEAISGIGPTISANIVAERKKGDFKDWNDLFKRVQGVGDRSAAKFSAGGMTINGKPYGGAPYVEPTKAPVGGKAASGAGATSTSTASKSASARQDRQPAEEDGQVRSQGAEVGRQRTEEIGSGASGTGVAARAAALSRRGVAGVAQSRRRSGRHGHRRRRLAPVEEGAHLVDARHRVLDAERDQLARVGRLEQQVAGERRAARVVALARDAEPAQQARIGNGRLVRWRAAMSSSRSLGEMTSTLIGFRLVCASARGGSSASVALIRCSRSTSTASASRKMFESAWPAICARFGYSLLATRSPAGLVHAAGADDEDALGAEVDGGRDRRRLAHRAVAAVLGVAG
jgi:competence protein ComEA